jgi:hypothetical protein
LVTGVRGLVVGAVDVHQHPDERDAQQRPAGDDECGDVIAGEEQVSAFQEQSAEHDASDGALPSRDVAPLALHLASVYRTACSGPVERS